MANNRENYNDEYKWNVKDLYKNDNEFKKELKDITKKIKNFKIYIGHILDNSNNLYGVLNLDTELSKKMERAYIYAHINYDADTLNSNYQELYGMAKNVYTKYLEQTSFIVPELMQSDYEIVKKYLKENKKLNVFKRNLKEIYRNKKHILNSDVENALSSLSRIIDSPDEIMGVLTDSDFKFDSIKANGKDYELTESNFSVYLRSSQREFRKQAFENLFKTYKSFSNTLGTILKNEVDKNVTLSRLRHYHNSLERSLFAIEIHKDVYFNLIKSVHNNLKSLYKYWDIKKQLLKLDELHIYDTYAEISDDNKKYSFEEAKELVLNAVKPLGKDYEDNIKKSFTDGWIDSCNNIGKRGGAYCTACYTVHPYVLLSYEGLLNDVSTLAHELGHAMHYFYACKYQNYQDYNYSIFVAEVASQVNEILLCRYLLEHSNNRSEKLKIIDDLLQKYKSTIYRQTMFAEFELFIHEYTEKGNILTSEVMCDKYLELNKLYFGDNVVIDDDIKYEWERIPHFYMNFYVWKYATGFASAVKIANQIYDGDRVVRDNYLEFLKLGSTKNPLNSLKVAGIDIKKDDVITDSIKFMNWLLEEYEKLQGSDMNE